jgi:predicted enzyme related to lactoylglutathione lyase
MRIKLNSVVVDDQSKALAFYTDVLGFEPSQDIPMGEFRWLTVRSSEGGETELALEPNANPAAREFQAAMFSQGIPWTAFEVDDVKTEFERLKSHGVEFTTEPMQAGPVWMAIFSDTCGNLIQIYQSPES